jgi:hypothetical protein
LLAKTKQDRSCGLSADDRPPARWGQGVFAAGDVCSGSTQRCATAVGEGAIGMQLDHAHLATLAPSPRPPAPDPARVIV